MRPYQVSHPPAGSHDHLRRSLSGRLKQTSSGRRPRAESLVKEVPGDLVLPDPAVP